MVTAPILTDAGRALLMRAIAGDGLVFTKFEIGSGAPPADAADLEELVSPEYEFGITAIDKTTSGYVTITGNFDNSIIEEPMRWTELGLYAKLDEQGADEVLYAYVNDGDDAGMLTPAGAVVAEQTVNLIIVVGDAENVTAIMAESAVFATKEELQEHEADESNPHNVTKAQVGLGNVENLPFDNQVVNFTAAGTLEEPLTGERMTTLMGKIKKGISSLISHIGNTQNPHGVTLAQLGAASTGHKHSAADITSGVLSTSRGGTGASALSTSPTSGSAAPITSDAVYTALSGKAAAAHTHSLDDLTETTEKKIFTREERLKLSLCSGTVNDMLLIHNSPPTWTLENSQYVDSIAITMGVGVVTVLFRNLKNLPKGEETRISTLPNITVIGGQETTVNLKPTCFIVQDCCSPKNQSIRVRITINTDGSITARNYSDVTGSLNIYAAITYVVGF